MTGLQPTKWDEPWSHILSYLAIRYTSCLVPVWEKRLLFHCKQGPNLDLPKDEHVTEKWRKVQWDNRFKRHFWVSASMFVCRVRSLKIPGPLKLWLWFVEGLNGKVVSPWNICLSWYCNIMYSNQKPSPHQRTNSQIKILKSNKSWIHMQIPKGFKMS